MPVAGDSHTSWNAVGRTITDRIRERWSNSSMAFFAANSGTRSAVASSPVKADTKTKRSTPAASAARTSEAVPSRSTWTMDTSFTPGRQRPTALAVVTTVRTPVTARTRLSGSVRSPATTSALSPASALLALAGRTSARNDPPVAASRAAIRPPR